VPVHDPEVEQDRLAFTNLERYVAGWEAGSSSPDFDYYGRSHLEMSYLAPDYNWISYLPYPEETPILLPELGKPPMAGKVLTLGEALISPSLEALRPQLTPLQRFLRSQQVFWDDRRQVALVGGIHGFHVCTWVPFPTRPYSRDGVSLYDFASPLRDSHGNPAVRSTWGSPPRLYP
jgi:hypothetical protein